MEIVAAGRRRCGHRRPVLATGIFAGRLGSGATNRSTLTASGRGQRALHVCAVELAVQPRVGRVEDVAPATARRPCVSQTHCTRWIASSPPFMTTTAGRRPQETLYRKTPKLS
ncbi:Os10g0491450 [Oryza sativa Japonica Group]|uniref:Os10g0491450 protein n=3 Tax=Oryza TaxID=4527 RepID=Q9FWU6_ORYSJ|nr:hypothetical protein [Oryza sativa Japonica Group]BAT11432.1 Os10g0491450 [Oryza sativa Japonica Group]